MLKTITMKNLHIIQLHNGICYMHQKYGIIALRLFLKDKGGKQHCLIPFVGSNLGVETFLKKREHQKRMR